MFSERAVLTTAEAALYLGSKPATLRKWRHRRCGPASFRVGGRVMYRLAALDAFLAECERADSRSNPELAPRVTQLRPRRDRSGRRVAEAA
ncbi:helix-turn-helix domain-containing protein [Streptomyces luteireticuli]|uniref:Helix-turn-helix domain-containing protein n=1 Tax=Streptomyces luteireticuli TaxID=173858 RepID=A0ABN0YZR9_9ACTN